MKALWHIVVGAGLFLICLPFGILAAFCAFATCTLIDIDHLINFWIHKRFTLNIFKIVEFYDSERVKLEHKEGNVVKNLIFHIPDLWPLWFGLAYMINPFLVLGYVIHIAMDFWYLPRWKLHSIFLYSLVEKIMNKRNI